MKQGWIQVINEELQEPLAPKTLADVVYVDQTQTSTVKSALDNKANKSHASADDSYGRASWNRFGHARSATTGEEPVAPGATGLVGTDSGIYARYNHRHPHGNTLLAADGTNSISLGNNFFPNGNGTIQLGTASMQFSTIRLVNNPVVSSDERVKKDIADIDEAERLIMGVRPRKFRRTTGEQSLHYGVVAQELVAALDEAEIEGTALYLRESVDDDIPDEEVTEDQVRYSVCYSELIAPMIAVMQEQQRRIDALEIRIAGGAENA